MVPAKARPASGSSRQQNTRPAPAPKPRPGTKPFRIPIVEISSPSSEAGMIDVRHDGIVRPDPNHQWTPEDLAMLKKVYPAANIEHTQRSDQLVISVAVLRAANASFVSGGPVFFVLMK